jgi:hypothetical protein
MVDPRPLTIDHRLVWWGGFANAFVAENGGGFAKEIGILRGPRPENIRVVEGNAGRR